MNVAVSDRPAAIAYFRGEGNCHIVIGFERNGARYVWRVRKTFSTDDDENYYEMSDNTTFCFVMSRLFKRHVVAVPQLISLDVSLLESVPHFQRHPVSVARQTSESTVYAMELPDLCYFTEFSPESMSNTVTVEIKPKQGFFPLSLRRVSPYCSNCLLQMVKSRNGTYESMYDFCPLDLYSLDFKRVHHAVKSLVKIPHANMKVFKNGQLVHSSQQTVANPTDLDKLFGHRCVNGIAQGEDFAKLIAKILTCNYVEDPDDSECLVPNIPLLQYMLLLQKRDIEGPFAISKCFKELMKRSEDAGTASDPTRIFQNTPASVRANALRSMITASLRDCSIMITMKIFLRKPQTSKLPALELPCGCFVVYRMRLIDLDYKSPAKLVSYASRLEDALKLVNESNWKTKRPPCVP
ncbi:Ins P5 2-kin domain containing protein [Trichuris trichiura]|uniref:Inositol-pentakisphosphate 2-kinase n=1 Tax=Trichuris trichiura TaxID=36087 RepID=A0A077Z1Y0_TRITR|nr:Ins P5 2-kin domain containing protein [Trichuris trichiura]